MKCLFPRLNSFGQKLICVGAGVAVTGGFVGGAYYSSKYIDYQTKVYDSINYVMDKRKPKTYEEYTPEKPPNFIGSLFDKICQQQIVRSCCEVLFTTLYYVMPVM